MKKFAFLLLIALTIISCEDNQTNQFAMQATIGDRLYTSTEAQGAIGEDGKFIIQGETQLESLTLRLSSLREGNFKIGAGFPNSATFIDLDGNLYQTKPNGTGLITISEVNETNKTLSGIFNFNSILPGIDTIYVSKGVLYNVPYDTGTIDEPINGGTLSAKVDGETFTPTTVSAIETGNSIAISGSNLTAIISLTVPSTVEIGEYPLPRNDFNARYQNETGLQPTSEGIITITAHNTSSRSIKGTFSFLTDENEITEGQFDVVY